MKSNLLYPVFKHATLPIYHIDKFIFQLYLRQFTTLYKITMSFIFALITLFLSTNGFSQEFLSGKQPEEYSKLSSILYRLAISENKARFAEEHGLSFFENKVRVFINFEPSSSNSKRESVISNHGGTIEKKAKTLVRVLVSVESLLPLAREPIIQLIKIPDKPEKQ